MELRNETGICSNLRGTMAFGLESGALMFLGAVSVILNGVCIKILFNCGGHLPMTIKFLLINTSFAALGKSLYLGFFYPLYNYVLLIHGFDAMSMSRTTCIIISTLYGISAYGLPISVMFIGCERLYSTWKKNLAQVERMTVGLINAQLSIWVISALVYVCVTTTDSQFTAKSICYCYYPMILGPGGGVLTNVVLVGTQSVNVVIYAFIYWKNRQNLFEFTLNTARYSLSERFIMWANIKTTLMLLPVSLLHALSNSIVTITNRLLRESFNYKVNDEYLCATLGIFCFMTIDTLGHPILCLKFNSSLKKIAAKFYVQLCCFCNKKTAKAVKIHPLNTVAASVHLIRQRSFNPVVNVRQSFNRPIIEYRIKPEEHQDILLEMWHKDDRKKRNSNSKVLNNSYRRRSTLPTA